MFKNIFAKGKKRVLIMALEIIVDLANDYIIKLKTGNALTPFKVEKDSERSNPISQTATDEFLSSLFKNQK